MKFYKHVSLFFLGGAGYVGLELLWRQRSHSSMFLLGGACFLALGQLDRALPKHSLLLRGFAGAGIVTALELLTGLLVNRSYKIWDYRKMPCHFQGQICLPYSLLWVPVSLTAMRLYRRLSEN